MVPSNTLWDKQLIIWKEQLLSGPEPSTLSDRIAYVNYNRYKASASYKAASIRRKK